MQFQSCAILSVLFSVINLPATFETSKTEASNEQILDFHFTIHPEKSDLVDHLNVKQTAPRLVTKID